MNPMNKNKSLVISLRIDPETHAQLEREVVALGGPPFTLASVAKRYLVKSMRLSRMPK